MIHTWSAQSLGIDTDVLLVCLALYKHFCANMLPENAHSIRGVLEITDTDVTPTMPRG